MGTFRPHPASLHPSPPYPPWPPPYPPNPPPPPPPYPPRPPPRPPRPPPKPPSRLSSRGAPFTFIPFCPVTFDAFRRPSDPCSSMYSSDSPKKYPNKEIY